MTGTPGLSTFLFRLRRVELAFRSNELATWQRLVGVSAYLVSLLLGYLMTDEPATSPALSRVWPWLEVLTILGGTLSCVLARGRGYIDKAWTAIPALFVPVAVRVLLIAAVAYPILYFGSVLTLGRALPETGMRYLFSLSSTSVFDLVFEEAVLLVQYLLLLGSVRRALRENPRSPERAASQPSVG